MTVRRRSGIVTAVAKMAEEDPETAQLFVQLSLFNTMADMIEQAGPLLEADTDAVIAKGAYVAREQLLANSAQMSEREIQEAALAVSVLDAYVHKSELIGAALEMFNRLHPRGQGGQFIRLGVNRQQFGTQSVEDRHRESHNQAENQVENLKRSGLIDEKTPLKLHYQRISDQGKVVSVGPDPKIAGDTNYARMRSDMNQNTTHDPTLLLSAVSFDRRGIPGVGTGEGSEQRRAALDAMMTFAGPGAQGERAPALGRLAQSIPVGQDMQQAGADWNRPGSWDDRKVYRRMELTGRALSAATMPGTAANTVGNLARLVGNLGPEAEKVLAPGMRRTAYRYRGTEHRPSPTVMRANDNVNEIYEKLTDESVGDERTGMTMGEINGVKYHREAASAEGTDAATGSAGHWFRSSRDEKLTDDQMWLLTHGDAAAISLVDDKRLPDLNAARISLEAGELPPSVGVIIDADGNVVSEAQGYNGDHYLPFDLKNLKSLQGGQYVRTRAAGGLTAEDLYTGLLAGARQVQVVSNSGVFTVEFDPDVRGGRRYTDKALRMINRYGKILETIQAGKIMRTDVPFARRQELQDEARRISRNKDRASVAETYNQLLEEERNSQEAPDEDELRQEAAAQVQESIRHGQSYSPQQRQQAINDTYQDLLSEYNAKQVRRLNLDGQGYGAAQGALRTEFPFFIRRVGYEPLPKFLRDRGQKPKGRDIGPRDSGFVERGQTNPRGAPGAPRYGLKPKARPESIGDQGAVQDRANAPATGQTSARGSQQSAPLNQALGAGGDVARKVAVKAGRLVNPLREWKGLQPIDPAGFRHTDESAKEQGALAFLYHRMMTEGHEEPEKFINWLLTSATDQDRAKIAEGLDDLEDWTSRLDDDSFSAATERMDPNAWGATLATVKAVAEAGKPFADPAPDMATAVPQVSRPLPQPFPDIVALGTDPAAYDQHLEAQDDRFKRHVDFLMGTETSQKKPLQDHEVAESVATKLEQYHGLDEHSTEALRLRTEIEAQQRAWAFVRGREIATKLQDVLGGGADPKVSKQDEPQESTLLGRMLSLCESQRPHPFR